MVRARHGWCRVVVRDRHIGLVQNIEQGVAEILARSDSGIFLEDDLLVGHHCIDYLKDALSVFRWRGDVFSVNGFAPYTGFFPGECALTPFVSSWGWATWSDRWAGIDLNPEIIISSPEEALIWDLPANSGRYLSSDWLWKWRYHIMKRNGLALSPKMAMCTHIGFDKDSTHFGVHHLPYPIYMNNEIHSTGMATKDDAFYHSIRAGIGRVPGVETIAAGV
jgi:hypothetical protein